MVYTLVLPCENLAFASETSGIEIVNNFSSLAEFVPQAFYLPGKLYNHDAYKSDLRPLQTVSAVKINDWYILAEKDLPFYLLPEDDSEYPEPAEIKETAKDLDSNSVVAAKWRLPHSCKQGLILQHLRYQIRRFCKLSEDEFQSGMHNFLQTMNDENFQISSGGGVLVRVWINVNPYLDINVENNSSSVGVFPYDNVGGSKDFHLECQLWQQTFKERIWELADFLDASFSQLTPSNSPLWDKVMITAANIGINTGARLLEPTNVTSYLGNLNKRAQEIQVCTNLPTCLSEMVSVYERENFKFRRR